MTATGYTSGDPRKLNRTGYVKGDVVAADASGLLGAVTVGANGEVLTSDSGDVRGVDWLPGGGGGGGVVSVNGQVGVVVLVASDVGAPPTTRQVAAGTGLTGGGDLSADRVFAVTYGTTVGTSAQGNDTRITGAVQSSTVDAKGDLLVGTADNTVARRPVGTNGQVLRADSVQVTGLVWDTLDSADVGADPAGTATAAVAAHVAAVDPHGDRAYTDSEIAAIDFPVDSVNGDTGTVVLTAADVGAAATVHTHAAGDITSGELPVARGGTGVASVTAGSYLRGAGTGALVERTPTEVRGDISAASTTHATTHAPAGSDPLAGLTAANFAAGSVDGTAGTASLRTLGTGAQQAAAGNHTHTTAARQTIPWSHDGDATTVTGNLRWYNRHGQTLTIVGAWVSAGTPPTGQALIVDVHLNGTTIFTTQANRPQVAAAGNGGTLATPDVTTFADGDYLTVDVDQVGSGTAGADIVVGIVVNGTVS